MVPSTQACSSKLPMSNTQLNSGLQLIKRINKYFGVQGIHFKLSKLTCESEVTDMTLRTVSEPKFCQLTVKTHNNASKRLLSKVPHETGRCAHDVMNSQYKFTSLLNH